MLCGGRLDACASRGADAQAHVLAGGVSGGSTRSIGRQVEHLYRRHQDLAPVGKICTEHPGGKELLLVVDDLLRPGPNGRQCWCLARDQRFVCRAEFVDQDVVGPAIDNGVLCDDRQQVLLWGKAHENGPDQRPVFDRASCGVDHELV
ncbi:unannotated protein [freshwater metagenome]|uniref:Unannotated protein n=1 Tax=freshwater metagenome TaxID=449393 RepID=A0A6J7FXQ1_9ZZZZ